MLAEMLHVIVTVLCQSFQQENIIFVFPLSLAEISMFRSFSEKVSDT